MVLPEGVKEHPGISILAVLGVFAGLGVLAVIFSQATLVDGSGDPCSWQKAVYPGNDTPMESKQDFQNYAQDRGAAVPEGLQLEYRNGGDLYYKAPCGKVGGGGTSQ